VIPPTHLVVLGIAHTTATCRLHICAQVLHINCMLSKLGLIKASGACSAIGLDEEAHEERRDERCYLHNEKQQDQPLCCSEDLLDVLLVKLPGVVGVWVELMSVWVVGSSKDAHCSSWFSAASADTTCVVAHCYLPFTHH